MDKLYLIYVNRVGKDYKGKFIYEFIFNDTIKGVDGEEWDTYPASGRPHAPHDIHIKKVGRIESDLNLNVIQESDTFAVWDAVDGVISLAYENINAYDSYPEHRLNFRYGEEFSEVEAKLYEIDIIMQFKNQNHETKN